jgi:hypothetical protein
LLTFFGKTKKVSQPRQGTKQQQTTNNKPKPKTKNFKAPYAYPPPAAAAI